MIGHIQLTCGLNIIKNPTIIYEYNDDYVAQVKKGYVKRNLTKHIDPQVLLCTWIIKDERSKEACILSRVKILLTYH